MSRAAVYSDNNWLNEVPGLNITSVQISQDTRVIGAPVETGTTSFDNKVIDPITVVVKGIIYAGSDSPLSELDKMILNRDMEFYSVSDGGGSTVNNLILKKFPTVHDVDKFDWIEFTLEFVEAMFIQSKTSSPANSEDSGVMNNGTMQGAAQ